MSIFIFRCPRSHLAPPKATAVRESLLVQVTELPPDHGSEDSEAVTLAGPRAELHSVESQLLTLTSGNNTQPSAYGPAATLIMPVSSSLSSASSSPAPSIPRVDGASAILGFSPMSAVTSDPVVPDSSNSASISPSCSHTHLHATPPARKHRLYSHMLLTPLLLLLGVVILTSEQGASVDCYLKDLSYAPVLDAHGVGNRILPILLSVDVWTGAFLVFMAILIADKPSEVPRLLQYAHPIHPMAKNTPGPLWALYDQEFCIQKQSDRFLPWEGVHTQLYFQLFSHFAVWFKQDNASSAKGLEVLPTGNSGLSPAMALFLSNALVIV